MNPSSATAHLSTKCTLESDDGVKVGKYVASTLIRQLHTGDLDKPGTKVRGRQAVADSLLLPETAKRLLDAVWLDVCLFFERGSSPYGEFCKLALARGLNVIQWCGSQRSAAFVLKRCTPANLVKLNRADYQTELAWKYAFGVFVLRLFHFSNLRIQHARDAAASMRPGS